MEGIGIALALIKSTPCTAQTYPFKFFSECPRVQVQILLTFLSHFGRWNFYEERYHKPEL
jgi:hypothetical protein